MMVCIATRKPPAKKKTSSLFPYYPRTNMDDNSNNKQGIVKLAIIPSNSSMSNGGGGGGGHVSVRKRNGRRNGSISFSLVTTGKLRHFPTVIKLMRVPCRSDHDSVVVL